MYLKSAGIAYIGDTPISSGAQPATCVPKKRPRGLRPRSSAQERRARTVAAAPSDI